MIDNGQNKLQLRELILLVLLLGLSIFMAYIIHLAYPYPVHHDEWMKMAYSRSVVASTSTTYVEPFSGQTMVNGITGDMENGFYIFCGILQQITGISWTDIFVYFPAFIFANTVLTVYIMARRQGFGLEAAFITCLLPTSVGILGPAFMVPLSIGLLVLPAILFFTFYHARWQGYLLILIITSAMVMIHGPSAIIILIVLLPYLIINWRNSFKQTLGLTLALTLPFILVLALFGGSIIPMLSALIASEPTSNYVRFPDIVFSYGLIPLTLSFAGIVYMFFKGGRRNLGLIFGLLCLLAVLLAFIRFNIGISIIYERGLVFLLLFLSIFAGAGLLWLRNLHISFNRYLKDHRIAGAGGLLAAVCVIAILLTAIPSRLNTNYYHMIDKSDFESFNWINRNLGNEYRIALVDPWKATAFTALTGKHTVHRIFQQRQDVDNDIEAILANGCPDSSTLIDNQVSFIYSPATCNNTDLNQINKNIYVVSPGTSKKIFKNNLLQNAGFERLVVEYPYPWDKWSENVRPDFLYPEPGINRSRSVSILMPAASSYEPWPQAIWGQTVPVTIGKTYVIEGWIKTKEITGPGGVMITAHWKAEGDKWIGSSDITEYIRGTNEWSHFQGTVTAPYGAVKCTICCFVAGCSGQAWFDDVIFEQTE